MTRQHWIIASQLLCMLLIALPTFSGDYRGAGILLFPVCLWLSLRNEPEQRQMRPWIRVLGWVVASVAAVGIVAAFICIATGY
jgi:hypothetical protein